MTETQNITYDIIPVIGKTYDWYGTLVKVVEISSEERSMREHSDGSISPVTTLYGVKIEYNSPRFGLSRINTPWTKYSFVPI